MAEGKEPAWGAKRGRVGRGMTRGTAEEKERKEQTVHYMAES